MSNAAKWISPVVMLTLFGTTAALLLRDANTPRPNAATVDSDWNEGQTERNLYAAREECVEDYSEDECPRERVAGSSGIFYFVGPWYHSRWRTLGPPPPATGLSAGPGRRALQAGASGGTPTFARTETRAAGSVVAPRVDASKSGTTRGGFGGTGRAMSSRGG